MADAKLATTIDITLMSTSSIKYVPAVKVRNLDANTRITPSKEATQSQHEARTRGRLDAG